MAEKCGVFLFSLSVLFLLLQLIDSRSIKTFGINDIESINVKNKDLRLDTDQKYSGLRVRSAGLKRSASAAGCSNPDGVGCRGKSVPIPSAGLSTQTSHHAVKRQTAEFWSDVTVNVTVGNKTEYHRFNGKENSQTVIRPYIGNGTIVHVTSAFNNMIRRVVSSNSSAVANCCDSGETENCGSVETADFNSPAIDNSITTGQNCCQYVGRQTNCCNGR